MRFLQIVVEMLTRPSHRDVKVPFPNMFLSILPVFMMSIMYAVSGDDFYQLRNLLKYEFSSNPRMIPLSVRLAFHDLFHQTTLGGRGCIQKVNFLNLEGNIIRTR